MSRSARAALCPRRPLPAPPSARAALCPRRPANVLFTLCVALAALLPTLAAHAGSYVWEDQSTGAHSPTYTGGAYASSGGPGTYTPPYGGPYSIGYDGTYGGAAYAYGMDITQAAEAVCIGTITAHFTWKPDFVGDGPPASAVVREDASFSAYNYATGSCDDGLGRDDSTLSGSFGSCSGTRYTVKASPGQGFDVTCSPSADAGGPASPYGVAGSAIVGYKATAYPVILGLGGTTKDDGGDNILVSQGCTGVLSAGPFYLDNYQWDVPGETFAAWDVASDYSFAGLVYPDTDWSSSSPKWHWSKDETVTVSCTANANVNGQNIGTVKGERQVKVWAPTYDFFPSTGGVYIDATLSGTAWVLGARAASGGLGSKWNAYALTPDFFTSSGDGLWHFLQLITPGRSKTLDNGNVVECSENGSTGLDTVYPYAALVSSDPYSVSSPVAGWTADGLAHSTGDYPKTGLDDTILRAQTEEDFQVYMMYQPPDAGNGKQWVPLHKFDWRWMADVTRPGTTWGARLPGISAGYVTPSTSQRWYEHPFWVDLKSTSIGTGW